ncbi:uncharacterized protein LOC127707905 [Mytilus californianus]|uniref:uncharacterized protein LOC127707905 n=1 Tax=Mytilus californianus TaxID=6549 RepID=UPI0022452472|nr:uncharacterized protein LOC127707905 [Mytilus californianus]XP_052068628.1 uncharacterized protein LOC127707905 [Mytilus californianus]
MACIICKIEKLRNEYPSHNVSKDCDHPSLTCLRCIVKYIDEQEQCPHPECGLVIGNQSETMLLFKAILSKQFKEYESAYTPLVDMGGSNQYINITGLTGESTTVLFSPSMTVDQLKSQIQIKLKHEKIRQKLLYEGKEMNVYQTNGGMATLSEYGVKPNSTICVVICLYSIPEHFDDVVFDLYWGYPYNRTDYLDASCLLFQGTFYKRVIDYRDINYVAVSHSGDMMDNRRRIGHHKINVSLKKIPSNITHLFFTLSAYNSTNIAQYPNPSLKFYDASKPGKDLCKTTFHHARNSQAVIMCSVSRNTQGHWEIFESGQLSAGNAKNYERLIHTIQQLISRGV